MAIAGWGVFAVALLASHASATGLFEWRGATMSFDESANWDGPVPDAASRAPCRTRIGSDTTLFQTLGPKRYFVGRQLVLNRVSLSLAAPGSSLAFTPRPSSAAPGTSTPCSNNATLTWLGGITSSSRNDFYCHENWLDNGFPASGPPCANTPVVFDPTETYRISLSPDVRMVVAGSITFGSTVVTDAARLGALLPQINLLNTSAAVYLGTNAFPVCSAALQISGAQCVCFSSCPTASMQLQYQDLTRSAAAQQASAQAAAAAQAATRAFSGTFTPAALGVTAAVLQLNLQNQTQVGLLAAALQQALVGLPAWSVAEPVLSAVSAGLRVAGSLNCSAGTLYLPGTSTIGPLNWAATALPTAAATALQNLIAITLSPLLAAYHTSVLEAQANEAAAQLPPAVGPAFDLLAESPAGPAALNLTANDACFASCTTDCDTCASALSAALQQSLNLTAADADSLAAALAAAKNATLAAGGNWSASTADLSRVIALVDAANEAAASAAARAPFPMTLRSHVLGVARSRSLVDQLRVLMPENRDKFVARLLAALAAAPGMLNVSRLSVGFTADYVALAAAGTSLARRSVAAPPAGPSAVTVQFDYTRMCVPGDSACLVPANSTNTLGLSLTLLLNQAFAMMPVAAPECQVLAGASAGFNTTCLTQVASAHCQALIDGGATTADARAATQGYLLNITRCGTQPPYPNGTCSDAAADLAAAALAAQISSASVCGGGNGGNNGGNNGNNGSSGAASSSSSGGLSLPVIAGAAGGGALLVLVAAILLLRRRKRGVQPASGKVDRTVVAFENPMYDEQKQAHVPVYEATSGRDSEGLYDEPAFNGGQKQNPVYQSNEDLSAQPYEGYLDVAPGGFGVDDAGYLDGQPASAPAAAEDIGYLGADPVYDNRDGTMAPE